MSDEDNEVIYPPRGFCIGFFIGNGGSMIGPFATEAEARQVLSEARICVIGANLRPDWDQGARLSVKGTNHD